MLPSRRCVGSATQAARSPPSSASLLPPSAGSCGSSSSTGSRRWEPAEPVRRYEREHPGEIIRLDIKKLGRFKQIGHRITGDRKGQSNSRGVGWECLHLAIDDHSRVACSEILPDEKRGSSLRFLFNALRFFRAQGVKVQRVMTDNGGSFRSRRYAKVTPLAQNQAPADQTLYAKDKQQSRAPRSNFIARMGLNASPSGSTLTPRGPGFVT